MAKCEKCGRELHESDAYERKTGVCSDCLQKEVHGNGKALGCYDCDAVFTTVEALEKHEFETGHGNAMNSEPVTLGIYSKPETGKPSDAMAANEQQAKAILEKVHWRYEWTDDEPNGIYGVGLPASWMDRLEEDGWIEKEVEWEGETWVLTAEMP